MTRLLVLLAVCFGLVSCGGGGGGGGSVAPPPSDACAAADNLTRVRGGSECLVIRTVAGSGTATTLLVIVHGDVSAGGPAEYLYPTVQKYSGPGIVAVGLLRPGYFDAQGNTSTGTNFDRVDSYTDANIAAVAGAVQKLKEFHKVSNVVYVGHSGGAAIGGVIAGKYPDLLDHVLLVACPCNIPAWRIDRGAAPWPRSLSPHDFIATVRPSARIVALTGTLDPNTFPHLASDYVASLVQRGVNASYVPIPGAMHNWGEGIGQSTQFDDALKAALAAPPNSNVPILMMGNSHTAANGLPGMIVALVRAAWPGRAVEAVEAPGWMFLEQRASDPASLELLRSKRWSFVVLQAQEYSSSGAFVYPITGAVDLVKQSRALGALPILFPEWPRAGINETQRILDVHLSIAREAPACVPPIPQAWDLSRSRHPEITLHASDGNHAMAPGSLLAAMVITATMTGASPASLPNIEGFGVDAAVQSRLRTIAAETVLTYPPRTGCPGDPP